MESKSDIVRLYASAEGVSRCVLLILSESKVIWTLWVIIIAADSKHVPG